MGALAEVLRGLAKPSPVHLMAAASCPASSRQALSRSNQQARTIFVFSQPQGANSIAMTMTTPAWKSTAKAGGTLAQRLTRASMVLISWFQDFLFL
jgi:hypothetical protein